MKIDRAYVELAVHAFAEGDPDAIDLIVDGLNEAEEAKARLRAAGYGVTGMGIVDTVCEVIGDG